MMLACYTAYLLESVLLTIWLGHTLHREGRLFLVDCFDGADRIADSVNHLLLVGFYLVNIAWIALTLKSGEVENTLPAAIEFVAHKTGIVGMLLGGMHFLNLIVFSQYKARQEVGRQSIAASAS